MKRLAIGKGQRPGIRLNTNGIETRRNILHMAALLFSKNGYAGTSFREITRESNTDLGSLVYHFGVKENLFFEAVSTFFPTRERFEEIVEPLEACGAESSPEEVKAAVARMVSAYLKEIHCSRKASFLPRFYARMMLDATPETDRLLKDRMAPVREKVLAFAKRVNPKLDDGQAKAWRRCLFAQMEYTIFSDKDVLEEFGIRSFKPDAVDAIAGSIAENSCLLLRLSSKG